jgi:hypothetical protein
MALRLGTARVTVAVSQFSIWPRPRVSAIIWILSDTHDAVRPFSQASDHLHRIYEFLTMVKMEGIFVTKAEAKIWSLFESVRMGVNRQLMAAMTYA